MPMPTDAANAAIAQLRDGNFDQAPVANGERIVPGIWLDMDTAEARHEATTASRAGTLLSVAMHATSPGRWFTLNVDIGSEDLDSISFMGVALRSRAPRTQLVRICIRNFADGGFKDVFFPHHLAPFAEESGHVDAVWLADQPLLRKPANWRTLIFFFDPAGVDLTLTDLHLFSG